MRIIRQIFNFVFSITLFLTVTALSLLFISKVVNNKEFTKKIVDNNLPKMALEKEEINLEKALMVDLGIDYQYHDQIDLTEVIADYLTRLIESKKNNPDKFVRIDEQKLEEAISKSSQDINYNDDHVSDIEKSLDDEFNTFFKSTRVKLILKIGQSNELFVAVIAVFVISLIGLYFISKRVLYVSKILLYSLILNIVAYFAVFGILSIPEYTGKFLAVFLNILLQNVNILILDLVVYLTAIVAALVLFILIKISIDKKKAKKKGIKTLDNFFDDYDVDLVIEEIEKREELTKEKKKKNKKEKK